MKNLIAIASGVGLTVPVATAFIVDGNAAAVIGAALSTIGLTLVVVGWIDRRIEHKIKNHESTERVQHYVILRELSNLRELLGHPALNIPEILKNERSG
jgi:hypothetical protein